MLRFTESTRLAVREYVSLRHIQSACYFSRCAALLETNDDGLGERTERHFAYASGSIGAAADFLEAQINEVIADAHIGFEAGALQRVSTGTRSAIARTPTLRDLRQKRTTVLAKYDAVLAAVPRPSLLGKKAAQRAQLVLSTKNGLGHFVPETVTTVADDPDEITQQELERQLGVLGLSENPLTSAAQLFFPDRVASHAFAAWSCDAVVAFSNAFFDALAATPPPYDHLRLAPRL